MGCKVVLGLFFAILTGFLSKSHAYKTFYVGGKDGWVVDPSESYNHWAERNRFQVNDTLYFKYNAGADSVLIVTKDDYYSCNTKNPIKSLTDGNSKFVFDRSGPFFFISGNENNCEGGQKLIVVVMAVRKTPIHKPPPSPTPSPVPSGPVSPSPSPMATWPPSPSPSPKPSGPVSPPPAPVAAPPAVSPSPKSSPSAEPSAESPEPDNPWGPSPAPAPAAHKSGSVGSGVAGSFGYVLGFTIIVTVVLGNSI